MNGKYLLINGKNLSLDVDDESLWREVFDKTVVATGTNKMRDFDVVKFPKQGITAFVLSESHISVHTYQRTTHIILMFSVKNLSPKMLLKFYFSVR